MAMVRTLWFLGIALMARSTNQKPGSSMSDAVAFSIVLGGPLYEFWRRTRLTGGSLELLVRRAVVLALFAWLPLLLLSALDGQLLHGDAAVPFLWDIEVHARFLIALPLLIAAELAVQRRMRLVASQFIDRRLIPSEHIARLDTAVASVRRLRDSALAEVLILVLVYVVGILVVWRHYVALDTSTWYATPTADGPSLSLAGTWYGYVSLPLFQFLMLRWYFRIMIWARFLWQVSRIPLGLVATHPDRVGGLGFLGGAVYAFVPWAMAHGAVLSGQLGNRIFYTGATLTDFKYEVLALVAVLLAVVLGPMFVFAGQLWEVKLSGSRELGTLAERYSREFDAKWIRSESREKEPLLGSADIQSLADLGNSFEVVQTMKLAPISKQATVLLIGATLAPLAPLALTMMPLNELLKKFFGLLF